MTAPLDKPTAIVEITSGLQLHASAVTKEGECVEVTLYFSMINAQKVANALLEYCGVQGKTDLTRNKSKMSVLASFSPEFKQGNSIVRLTEPRRSK